MQIEIELKADAAGRWSGRDLGHLLHKHPDRVFSREIPCGNAVVFFTVAEEAVCRAVLHVETDPIGTVRSENGGKPELLKTYVNDRPWAASSFLSLAISKTYGQSMAGKCASRPDLTDVPLPFEVRIVPVWAPKHAVERFFAPLGYDVSCIEIDTVARRTLHDVVLKGIFRLSDILKHVHVLLPALDGWKHSYLNEAELDSVLAKGERWLESHPAREEILDRSFGRLRTLRRAASERFIVDPSVEPNPFRPKIHDLRTETVARTVLSLGASSVLDLGCGEGRLLSRLVSEPGIKRLLGVEISDREIARARTRIGLDDATPGLAERVQVVKGSLVYSDERFEGFDAVVLVEVIEHVDPGRLVEVERTVFASAAPRSVVVTTPNAEYNALFEGRPAPGDMRHSDHRFEWTRDQFREWCSRVGAEYGYGWRIEALGEEDPVHGSLSQMAVFARN